jgi:hypothetical protein
VIDTSRGVTLKEAVVNQYQAILAAGAIGFSLIAGSFIPLLVLAGIECLLLPTVVGNQRLANALEMRRRSALGGEQGLPPHLPVTDEGLSFERRQRFNEIQTLAAVVEKNYARLSEVSQPLLLEQRAKLDQLLVTAHSHLKALEAYEELTKVQGNEEALGREIDALEKKTADPSLSASLRSRHEETLAFKRKLLASLGRSRETRESLFAQLDSLETALRILAQESAVLGAPSEVSARLDELVQSAEATSETVRELEDLARVGVQVSRQKAVLAGS